MSTGDAAPASTPARRPGWRRLAVLLLIVGVTLAHVGVGQWWHEQGLGDEASAPLKPIEVAFVKELPTTRPVVARPRPAPARPLSEAAVPVDEAASAPPPAASQPEPPAPEPVAAASAPAPAASEPVVAEAPADGAPVQDPFDWPPSTQLRYDMVGNYRGPIYGDAKVEWARDGQHYQVRLEVSVPPLFTRRMISDGELGPDGLHPQRYDQETQVALQSTRRETVHFEPGTVKLANGREEMRPAGVQDTASQFVQMTWMFLTQPQRLQVGATVDFPLALTRRVGQWTYRVAEHGPVTLPFGEIDTFHLVPERTVSKPNELTVETWVAPGLLYLPVRILIRQDAETYLDLQLNSRPRSAQPKP